MEESHKSHGREYFPWLPFILSAAGDVFLCCVISHSQPLCPLVLCSTACVSMWFRANFRRTDLFVKWHAAWRPAMFHSCSLLKQERVFQRYLDTLAFSLNWLKDTCDGSMAMAWFYNVYVFAGAQVPKYTGLCCLLGVDHVARKELQKQRLFSSVNMTRHSVCFSPCSSCRCINLEEQPCQKCYIWVNILRGWHVHCMHMLKTSASH